MKTTKIPHQSHIGVLPVVLALGAGCSLSGAAAQTGWAQNGRSNADTPTKDLLISNDTYVGEYIGTFTPNDAAAVSATATVSPGYRIVLKSKPGGTHPSGLHWRDYNLGGLIENGVFHMHFIAGQIVEPVVFRGNTLLAVVQGGASGGRFELRKKEYSVPIKDIIASMRGFRTSVTSRLSAQMPISAAEPVEPPRIFTPADPGASKSGPPKGETEPPVQVRDVRFSPDGKVLAAAINQTTGHTVHLWDVRTGKRLRVLDNKTQVSGGIAFSPDGVTIATLGYNCEGERLCHTKLSLWKVSTGQFLRSLELPVAETITSPVFSPNGKTIAVAGMSTKDEQSRVLLFDAANGKLSRAITGLKGWPGEIAFSSDSRLLAAADYRMNGQKILGSDVKVWQVANGKLQQTLRTEKVIVEMLAFSPNGRLLAANGHRVKEGNSVGDSDLRLWNLPAGTLRSTLTREGTGDSINSVDFSADGKTLFVAGLQGMGVQLIRGIWLWDNETSRFLRPLYSENISGDGYARTFIAELAPDGKTIAVGIADGQVQLRDATTGALMRRFNHEQSH